MYDLRALRPLADELDDLSPAGSCPLVSDALELIPLPDPAGGPDCLLTLSASGEALLLSLPPENLSSPRSWRLLPTSSAPGPGPGPAARPRASQSHLAAPGRASAPQPAPSVPQPAPSALVALSIEDGALRLLRFLGLGPDGPRFSLTSVPFRPKARPPSASHTPRAAPCISLPARLRETWALGLKSEMIWGRRGLL